MAAKNPFGHPIAIFATLGAISGVISGLWSWLPPINVPAFFYGMPPDKLIPLRPAIAFALALAIGTGLTVTRRAVPLLIIMASVFAGWWTVMEFAAHFDPSRAENWLLNILYWGGFGLVGALIVGIGGMVAGLYERSLPNLALIGLAGAVTGPLILLGTDFFMPLFVGWQTAVAAAIGHAIARSRPAVLPVPA